MATIKSYTDLSQSKKLAEILPLESADMSWILVNCGDEAGSRHEPSLATYKTGSFFRDRIFPKDHTIPCWSLAALLSILPVLGNKHAVFGTSIKESKWHVLYHNIDTLFLEDSGLYDNLVDACVVMIERLHELNSL